MHIDTALAGVPLEKRCKCKVRICLNLGGGATPGWNSNTGIVHVLSILPPVMQPATQAEFSKASGQK